MNTQLLSQLRQLSTAEQLDLIEALWDGIAMHNALPSLTAAQRAELDRRLADHEENPDDVVAWSEVKAAALARIQLVEDIWDSIAEETSGSLHLSEEERVELHRRLAGHQADPASSIPWEQVRASLFKGKG